MDTLGCVKRDGREMPDDGGVGAYQDASGRIPQWRCIATHVTPHDWRSGWSPTVDRQYGIYEENVGM